MCLFLNGLEKKEKKRTKVTRIGIKYRLRVGVRAVVEAVMMKVKKENEIRK